MHLSDFSNFETSDKESCSFLQRWKSFGNKYPVTFKLARAVQVLSYSSVPIERKFSQLTDIKTLKRNRLSVENLQACLFVKQEHHDEQITEEMIRAYMDQSYSNEIIPSSIIKDHPEESKDYQEESKEGEISISQPTHQIHGENTKDSLSRREELGSHKLKQAKILTNKGSF